MTKPQYSSLKKRRVHSLQEDHEAVLARTEACKDYIYTIDTIVQNRQGSASVLLTLKSLSGLMCPTFYYICLMVQMYAHTLCKNLFTNI